MRWADRELHGECQPQSKTSTINNHQSAFNAVEAIECHIEGLLIDGETVPPGRSIEHHRKNRQFSGGIWALVDIDMSKLSGKAKRVNITLLERLLVQIDSFASRTGDPQSEFVPAQSFCFLFL